jgi:CysZ protein
LLKEIITAISAYGKAHFLIKEHKLWKWILLPGLLYMLLFGAGIYFFAITIPRIINTPVLNMLGIRQWLEQTDSALLNFMFSFTGLAVWMVAGLFYFSLFKYVWLIVGAPVFSWISELTTHLVAGKPYNFSTSRWFKDIGRGIRLALHNLLWQSVYFIALLLMAFIPVIGWVVPFFALLLEAYYFGFSMLDYSFERKQAGLGSSIRFISTHKGLAIGNGIVFYLMLLVPIAGWIFAPAYGVMAATLTVEESKGEGNSGPPLIPTPGEDSFV